MPTVIEAKDLYKTYTEKRGLIHRKVKRVEALKGVSFKVEKGTVFGLLGPNGAGKTTTVKILSTLLIPDKGRAWIMGYDVLEEPEKVREIIGVSLSVERGFFWKLTGYENLKYFGMLRGLSGRELDKRITELMDLLGLLELGADTKFYEDFSLGMKARLSLARALIHDPPILILDEPTLGLDPASSRHIRNLIVQLAHEEGKTVLITSHNMWEVEVICDYVAIINKGRIIAMGTVPELKRMVSREIPIEITSYAGKLVSEDDLEKIVKDALGIERVAVKMDKQGEVRIRILVENGMEDNVVNKALEILRARGLRILEARVMEPSLEDVFIKLTSGARS